MNMEINEYTLANFKKDFPVEDKGNITSLLFQTITFYEMFPDGSYKNGTTIEEVLRVALERLTTLDNKFHCEENENAIKHIFEAISQLNKRTEDRIARGVEGKHIN